MVVGTLVAQWVKHWPTDLLDSTLHEVTGRFGPIPVRTPGRFGPIPFRSGRFGQGRFGPILEVGRFGPIWWVVSAHFVLYSFLGKGKLFWLAQLILCSV